MPPQSTASAWSLNIYRNRIAILIDIALEMGCPPAILLDGSSLLSAQMLGQQLSVSMEDQLVIMGNVVRVLPESHIGLRWGERLGVVSRDRAGLLLMSSATLGEALDVMRKLTFLLRLPVVAPVEEKGDLLKISLHFPDEAPDDEDIARLHVDCVFASLVTLCSELLQRSVAALDVSMKHECCVYADVLEQVLGCQPRFGASEYSLTLPRVLLSCPLPTANRVIAQQLHAELGDELRRELQGNLLAPRVKSILDSCQGSYPGAISMARRVHVSERTLHRQLAQEKTSYRKLRDEVRAQHAAHLLRRHELSVEAVALQMGFSNTANFRRAFRRWSGRSPSDWRHDDWD